tara:strand:+ start:394 stop:864 length:471 start_codon:yes stop_codon:yes gene_type:complete
MKHRLILVIISIFLSACGSDFTVKNDPYRLNGSWVANCYQDGQFFFNVRAFNFLGDSWSSTTDVYSDVNCSKAISINSTTRGKFNLGDSIITESGVTAIELNLNIQFLDGVDLGAEGSIKKFDLIKVENNQLYIGEYVSSFQRPTKLDFNTIYYRQ